MSDLRDIRHHEYEMCWESYRKNRRSAVVFWKLEGNRKSPIIRVFGGTGFSEVGTYDMDLLTVRPSTRASKDMRVEGGR